MRCANIVGLVLILSLTFVPFVSTQNEHTVFIGVPTSILEARSVKEDTNFPTGIYQQHGKLPEENSARYICELIKRGEKYYLKANLWKLQKECGVIRIDTAPPYILFKSVGDSPTYIRMLNPLWKDDPTIQKLNGGFEYMEHTIEPGLGVKLFFGRASFIDPAFQKKAEKTK